MEAIISESELALIRFNYESVWKKCVKLIQEGKLLVVEDTRPNEFMNEDIGNIVSKDSCIFS